MTSNLPTGKNHLTELKSLITQAFNFNQVLDYARYIVRVDPDKKVGYFESDVKIGRFAGKIVLEPSTPVRIGQDAQHYALSTTAPELPTQVLRALERAGYAINTVRCGA